MNLPTLPDIEAAARVVYREFQATPQYRWATLSQRLGTDCWVKHENHTRGRVQDSRRADFL